MQLQLQNDCNNRRCPRVHWNGSENALFCSHQCAYTHALELYRRSATPYAFPSGAPAVLPDQSGWPVRIGKCHTFTLIGCGIDPWAAPAEIHMRQQSCNMLIAVLGRYSSRSKVADYAWPLENMNYCIAYLPEFESIWSDARSAGQCSCPQRYQLVSALLVRHIECGVPFVNALLGGLIHPSEFYATVFA